MPSAESAPALAIEQVNRAAARRVRRVLQQWPLIVACALLAGIAGYFASSSRTPQYESSTTIQLNELDLGALFIQQNVQQFQDTSTRAATNAKLITLPRVMEAAARALDGKVTPGEVNSAISVAAEPDTTLVQITARDESPQFAARKADAVRDAFIEVRRQASLAQLNSAKTSVMAQLGQLTESQRESVTAQSLRERLQQIDTLRAASNGGVETVQTARVPGSAISPSPKRDAILALLAGGLLGVGIALLRGQLDTRVRDRGELSELWDLPVLGLIPDTSDLRRAGRGLPSAAALEAFSLARTNLRYLHVGGDVKTLVVTSALAGEGKSTVAWNLALAAAMADSRVLVIDADLRRPVFADRLELSNERGFSEVLAGLARVEDAIRPVTIALPGAAPDAVIDVIPAGLVPPSPIALLERARTGEILKAVGRHYDLVIIDTPPSTVVADAKVLLDHADGVVVVSRLGYVTRSALLRMRDTLAGLDTPVLGTIVNAGISAKAYGYTNYAPVQPGPSTGTRGSGVDRKLGVGESA